jgi:hypothetical protein
VLQNLANDVEFGEKESYMIAMNSFIQSNQKKCTEFFKRILVCLSLSISLSLSLSLWCVCVCVFVLVYVYARECAADAAQTDKFTPENPQDLHRRPPPWVYEVCRLCDMLFVLHL